MKQENDGNSKLDPGLLQQVGLDDFNREVLAEERPVLLLCMPRDASFFLQISEIEKAQLDYQQALKICLLDEDFLSAFMAQYGVMGTPTFLIFSNKTEKGRLLGRASYQDLARFIRQSLPELTPTPS